MDFTALYDQERMKALSETKNYDKKTEEKNRESIQKHPALQFGSTLIEFQKWKQHNAESNNKDIHSNAIEEFKPQPQDEREYFYRDWTCLAPTNQGLRTSVHSVRIKLKQTSALGHGGLVWDCSLVLAKYLETGFPVKFWKGKHVLELGAGTGLAGLVTASLGASRLVLSDLKYITPLLEENVRLNQAVTKKCNIKVVDFCWGSTDPTILSTEFPRRTVSSSYIVETDLESWKKRKDIFLKRLSMPRKSLVMDRNVQLSPFSDLGKGENLVHGKRAFDVIVASDVVYDPSSFGPFREVLDEICGPDTLVILSHEWREKEKEELFFNELRPQYFCEMVPKADMNAEFLTEDISVFKIRRLAL